MEGTGRDLLLETLDDLRKDDLKRLKHKLRVTWLEEGYQAIPWGQLEKGDPMDVTDLLISHCGEQRQLAERLSRAGKERARERPACPYCQGLPAPHFVSQHREQLIQQVMAVDGILDSLCGSVLDLEQIQSIRAERSSMEKMRKLYELVPKWDNDCKDRLYQALKEKHRPLVEELEGI
uniref:Apoptosis-associated speck-like protein containing a CARD n=1 Tax=Gopherus evgoodei TaxID=1825980 RepID=A0A8C4WD13_9SAUR